MKEISISVSEETYKQIQDAKTRGKPLLLIRSVVNEYVSSGKMNLDIEASIAQLVACKKCNGRDVVKQGTLSLASGKYQMYHCKTCGLTSTEVIVDGRTIRTLVERVVPEAVVIDQSSSCVEPAYPDEVVDLKE